MALKQNTDGTVVADTAEEMAQFIVLQKRFAQQAGNPMPQPKQAPTTVEPPAEWSALMKALSLSKYDKQRRLLTAIKAGSMDGVGKADLMKAVGSDTGNGLGGMFGGLTKVAQNVGIAINDIYWRDGEMYFAARLLLNLPLDW